MFMIRAKLLDMYIQNEDIFEGFELMHGILKGQIDVEPPAFHASRSLLSWPS